MVFRRRKFYKKRGYKRSRKSGWTALGIAKTALKAANFVKSIVNAEKKNFDLTQNSQTYSNTGTIVPLSLIAEGADDGQRNGRSVKASSLFIRIVNQYNAAATVPCRVRVMIVADMQARTATFAITDLLDIASTVAPIEIDVGDPSRFRVLRDKIYTLHPYRPANQPKYFIKLNHHIKFGDTGGAPGGQLSGALYAVFITDVAANQPTYTVVSRLRYYDN